MHTFAILGSHPNLSLAELEVVTGGVPTLHHEAVAVFSMDNQNLSQANKALGGVQKLGVIVGSLSSWNHDDLCALLAADLQSVVSDGKISFGLSVYSAGDDKTTQTIANDLHKAGLSVKTELKTQGRSSRFVMAKAQAMSAIILHTNHLLDRGAEYCLLPTEKEILVGRTLAAQDAQDWSTRDFGRPRRNAKQGMLPPKLSRMMLNLTGIDVASCTVFDPFCGSGTILMEASILGAKTLIGSDINATAIEDTKANLDWLERTGVHVPETHLIGKAANQVAEDIAPRSVDLLVTETYLGRPRRGTETRQEVKDTVAYVANLYREAFTALKPVLAKGATLVIASPVHTFEDEVIAFDVRAILEPLGYTNVPLPHDPLVYQHHNQLVGRRIWKFVVEA